MRGAILGLAVFAASAYGLGYWMNSAPGSASKGQVPALSDEEQDSEGRILALVESLHGLDPQTALDEIEALLRRARIETRRDGNCLEATLAGGSRGRENLLLATRVDADHVSGPAVLAETTRLLAQSHTDHTVRCLWFAGAQSVSDYEKSMRARNENLRGWIVLDGVGRCQSSGLQQHWPWFAAPFQHAGTDSLVFQSGIGSRGWLETVVREFRMRSRQPSAALSAPEDWLSPGRTAWSESPLEHVFVSDTGPWRTAGNSAPGTREQPAALDGACMARTAHGLSASAVALARRNRLKL